MLTTKLTEKLREAKSVDEYLGYTIQEAAGRYLAVPRGFRGEVLEAPSMPAIRRTIWRWWYQVNV